MHLYRKKNKIAGDRPQGVNIPCGGRRLIKVVSGDTLTFTATVVSPVTRDPIKKSDLDYTEIYVAVAQTRFDPVLWSGSVRDRWVVLDENRNGLVHITIPRVVMGALRRGSYSFSVVVDDGIVRETQLTGNFQIEYEPTGSINDIPYRNDQEAGSPISLTPEIDLAAQENHRLTYDQMILAVRTISETLTKNGVVLSALFGSTDYSPTEGELEHAIHRLSQLIIWDDALRKLIPSVSCDSYDPTFEQLVQRVCVLLESQGKTWEGVPCKPEVGS